MQFRDLPEVVDLADGCWKGAKNVSDDLHLLHSGFPGQGAEPEVDKKPIDQGPLAIRAKFLIPDNAVKHRNADIGPNN